MSWEMLLRRRVRGGSLLAWTCCRRTVEAGALTGQTARLDLQMRIECTEWRLWPAASQVRQSVRSHGRCTCACASESVRLCLANEHTHTKYPCLLAHTLYVCVCVCVCITTLVSPALTAASMRGLDVCVCVCVCVCVFM